MLAVWFGKTIITGAGLVKIICKYCGKMNTVNGMGRKSLNIGVKIVYDALQACSTVREAAELLGCSRPYIYKVLKDNGKTRKDIVTNVQTKNQFNRIKAMMNKKQ